MAKNVIEIIDKTEDDNRTTKQALLSKFSPEQKQAYNMLQNIKKNEKRKGTIDYKNKIRLSFQALASGTYSTLENGDVISGAEILAINAFERAMYDDKALNTFLKTTGDMNEKIEVSIPSYEEYIKKTKVVF